MRLEEEYFVWNKMIADAVYPSSENPAPVFLDIEGNALDVLAGECDIPLDDVIPSLLAVIRPLLNTRTLKSTFDWFTRKTSAWKNAGDVDEPPAIALLSVFALAASRMEASEAISASNYYAQLAKLLDLAPNRLVDAYRNVSDELWDSINIWLNFHGGKRGIPIEFTIGSHTYVGRARAQALLRDIDRRRLQEFFQRFDLSPLSEMSPEQLRPLFEQWVATSVAPSQQLIALWRHENVQEHLLTAVSGVLAGWDGHLSDRDESGAQASRVRIGFQRSGLRQNIQLFYILDVPKHEEARHAILKTTEQDHKVELVPNRPGEMVIPELAEILTPEVMLEGSVTFTDEFAGEITRRPTRLIVLREDQATGVWIEVSQVKLGDEIKILLRENYDITEIINDISGTEWAMHSSATQHGLPDGWHLMEGIVVSGTPQIKLGNFDDRTALVPITQVAFDFAGGVKLPTSRGMAPHFHHAAAPALTVSANGKPFVLQLFDLLYETPTQVEEPWHSENGEPVVVNLAELNLDPGPYGFHLNVQGAQRDKSFWLVRSGSSFEASWKHESVVHNADDPLFSVNRESESTEKRKFTVHGVPTYTVEDVPPVKKYRPQLHFVPWWKREREKKQAAIQILKVEEDSCIWTGKHHEHVGTSLPDSQGHHRGTSIGVCIGCGRERRYYNSYWRNHRRWKRNRERNAQQSRSAMAVTQREKALGTTVDWDLVRDFLLIVGGGDAKLLRKITQQFDSSAHFFHEFVTTLETLGHIEVRRDFVSGEVTHWETAPTTVIEMGDHRRLLGHWTAEDLHYLESEGITLNKTRFEDAPSLITTRASVAELETVFSDLTVVERPDHTLAASLPRLSELIDLLPTIPLPNVLQWERYDAKTDDWLPLPAVEEPGAYRSVGFGRRYFLVNEDDLAANKCREVNVPLAKHASAMMDRRYPALMAYSPKDQQIIVPLGAPLPGMYGRAATLASGKPPRRRDLPGVGSYVVYEDISADLAQRLVSLIGT